MKVDNAGNNRYIISLADGTTIFFAHKTPMAIFLPEKGFYRRFDMNHDDYLITHKYVSKWRSKDCQIVSSSLDMERLIADL